MSLSIHRCFTIKLWAYFGAKIQAIEQQWDLKPSLSNFYTDSLPALLNIWLPYIRCSLIFSPISILKNQKNYEFVFILMKIKYYECKQFRFLN